MKLAILILTLASAAAAQSKSPVSDALRQMLGGREKNTVAAFEEMPADKYDYKPTADQMTFGHLAAHIVEANNYFCANVGDVPEPKVEELKGTEGKDKLVAAMKASFEFCHTALEKADDSKMTRRDQMVRRQTASSGDGIPRPRQQLGRSLRRGGDVSAFERPASADREEIKNDPCGGGPCGGPCGAGAPARLHDRLTKSQFQAASLSSLHFHAAGAGW